MRFREEQRFEGGWRWFWGGLMLGPVAVTAVPLLAAAATGADLTPVLLILAGLGLLGLGGLILLLRTPVVVEVGDEGVRVRVPPVFTEHVPAAEIVGVEEVSSGLRRRYGAGAGKRYAERRARYTVGNDAGVVLERTNGWRVVIGSKRPGELAAAIRDLMRSPTVD